MKNLESIRQSELKEINGGNTNPGVHSEPGNQGCTVPNPLQDILDSIGTN